MIKFIDFWAPWCQPCRIMNPIIEELEKKYQGEVDFSKVNVDEDTEQASKFGVMSIPTFVVLKDDREMGRKIGVTSQSELEKLLNS